MLRKQAQFYFQALHKPLRQLRKPARDDYMWCASLPDGRKHHSNALHRRRQPKKRRLRRGQQETAKYNLQL